MLNVYEMINAWRTVRRTRGAVTNDFDVVYSISMGRIRFRSVLLCMDALIRYKLQLNDPTRLGKSSKKCVIENAEQSMRDGNALELAFFPVYF